MFCINFYNRASLRLRFTFPFAQFSLLIITTADHLLRTSNPVGSFIIPRLYWFSSISRSFVEQYIGWMTCKWITKYEICNRSFLSKIQSSLFLSMSLAETSKLRHWCPLATSKCKALSITRRRELLCHNYAYGILLMTGMLSIVSLAVKLRIRV